MTAVRRDCDGAEDDGDVAAHVALDDRRAEHDEDVAHGLALLEGVVLADAKHVPAPAAALPVALGDLENRRGLSHGTGGRQGDAGSRAGSAAALRVEISCGRREQTRPHASTTLTVN